MIVFIGQNPSKRNTNKDVPFVGTASHKELNKWLLQMQISPKDVVFINASSKVGRVTLKDIDYAALTATIPYATKIVCLGDYAKAAYLRAARSMGAEVDCFFLPHPSPRNRALNDRKKLHWLLDLCAEYIHDKLGIFSAKPPGVEPS